MDDGSLKPETVCRKPTHTDQYLNFESNHPLQHKRSVVRTLLNRTDTIVSQEEDKSLEKRHVRQALSRNNYPKWAMNLKKRRPRGDTEGQERSTNNIMVGIPFVQGLSEKLARILKSHGVTMFHKPVNTLRQSLVRPKDKQDQEKRCGVIYQMTCETCDASYIGETVRALGVREKEHRKAGANSAVSEHIHETGHKMGHAKILEGEENWVKRRVKEAIHILQHTPSLNRDTGWEIPNVYHHVLTRDRTRSRDQN